MDQDQEKIEEEKAASTIKIENANITIEKSAAEKEGDSDKSYMATFLFAFLLGPLGADRFYTGHIGLGVLKLLTFGGCGIWYLVDLIMVFTGARTDVKGLKLTEHPDDKRNSFIIFVVGIAVSGVVGMFGGGN